MDNTAKANNNDIFADLDLDFGDLTAGQAPQKTVPLEPVQKKSVVTPVQFGNNQQAGGFDINLAKSGAAKLLEIEGELNEMFLERDSLIRDMLRCVIVGLSMLMLGPPGTGKSMLIQEFCSRIINGKYFSWLLNKTSDPAEILGPHSVKGMERDQFIRKTAGKLPEAVIAFLDEIFKSNEPTLNILLSIINEKIFYNDGKAVPVPLISLFGASNEPPEDESLDALYDRLMFRHMVQPIKDPANRKKMHMNFVDLRSGAYKAKKRTTITLEELLALGERAAKCTVDSRIDDNYLKLLNNLEKQGVRLSGRRENECIKIMQGNAVLNDRDNVILDDLQALIYVLWEEEKDIPVIESEILKLVNPYDDKMKQFTRKFVEIKSDIDSITDEDEKSRHSIEAKGALEDITSKLDKLIVDATKNGKDTTTMAQLRQEIVTYNQKMMQDALGINLGFGGPMDGPF